MLLEIFSDPQTRNSFLVDNFGVSFLDLLPLSQKNDICMVFEFKERYYKYYHRMQKRFFAIREITEKEYESTSSITVRDCLKKDDQTEEIQKSTNIQYMEKLENPEKYEHYITFDHWSQRDNWFKKVLKEDFYTIITNCYKNNIDHTFDVINDHKITTYRYRQDKKLGVYEIFILNNDVQSQGFLVDTQSQGFLVDTQIDSNIIQPCIKIQVRDGNISYGSSSVGYDIRLAEDVQIFQHLPGEIVDPKRFNPEFLQKAKIHKQSNPKNPLKSESYVILPANTYALGHSVEHFTIPKNVFGICMGKSTYARCGIIANITPLEPGWRGYLTIEISNASSSDVKIYLQEGIAQILFYKTAVNPMISYADNDRKYQNQGKQITLPKL